MTPRLPFRLKTGLQDYAGFLRDALLCALPSPLFLLHWICGDFKEWKKAALLCALGVSVVNAAPLLAPRQAAQQTKRMVRAVVIPPRLVVTKLSLTWPAAEASYQLTVRTNEFDLDMDAWSFSGIYSNFNVAFTNVFRQRPARYFFALQLWTNDVAQLLFTHWPRYPELFTGVRLTWTNPDPITIESSTDLAIWQWFVTTDGGVFDVPATEPKRYFRSRVPLSIAAIWVPDPRDL